MELYAKHKLAGRRWKINERNNKKILPKYLKEVKTQNKNFELRKDDVGIQAGDILILEEWTGEYYTGDSVTRKVKYVLHNVPEYGLAEGFCIIGW